MPTCRPRLGLPPLATWSHIAVQGLEGLSRPSSSMRRHGALQRRPASRACARPSAPRSACAQSSRRPVANPRAAMPHAGPLLNVEVVFPCRDTLEATQATLVWERGQCKTGRRVGAPVQVWATSISAGSRSQVVAARLGSPHASRTSAGTEDASLVWVRFGRAVHGQDFPRRLMNGAPALHPEVIAFRE